MIGRIPVTDVTPVVRDGHPARAVVGEDVEVQATVFREGHDLVGATAVLRDPAGRRVSAARMWPVGLWAPDRWRATLRPTGTGLWRFTVEGWADPVASWLHNAGTKLAAGQDVDLDLREGADLFDRAAAGVPADRRGALADAAARMRNGTLEQAERFAAATGPAVTAVFAEHPLRDMLTVGDHNPLWVDRERALYGSWYEFFPRSEGARLEPPRSGTFETAARRLPAIAGMGFDVVYLPPIHPIGRTFRKGPNNTLDAGPDAVGVPWAIGSADGGHDAVDPQLGTIEDFDAFVAEAAAQGLEVALDLALQCSPDHPWVAQHPEWFTTRADGSIAYAENPPKKYQDIYPLNFDNDRAGLQHEVLRIVRYWMAHGVRIFRVDNPHTKPLDFWEWLLAEVHRDDPDVVFLAEAFTRPPMMHTLARIGFTQSYTYFTWRNSRAELEEYLTDLTSSPTADYMRPNFFVNTPDILHAYLQYGGPPAFAVRATLAATMVPTWGVYSGFELYEHVAVRPGSEEYLDSEKYQLRPRDWAAAEREGRSLAPYLTLLNRIRREHPALQRLRGLVFHDADQPEIIAYSRRVDTDAGPDCVLTVVNLDPHAVREATLHVDLASLGVPPGGTFEVLDLVTGARYTWGEWNYVRLDPFVHPAHVFAVTPR